MKSSVFALSVVALLAFGSAMATTPAASTAASPAASAESSTTPASDAKKGKSNKKTTDTKKTADTKAAPTPKPVAATTAPMTSRAKQPGQEKKMNDCEAANKGKTGDDYKNAVSDCIKGSAASDAKK